MVLDNSKFVFLLAGYAEDEAVPYLELLKKQMKEFNIPYSFLEAMIAAERSSDKGQTKYSLFDTYPFSDLISYPSQVEGWGSISRINICKKTNNGV